MTDPRLLALAKRHIWWLSPEEAIEYPKRVYAMVMDRGSLEDMQELISIVGEETLRQTLREADAGQFRPISWSYWQFRLNHLYGESLPPMPKRRVP